jgi:hypothetical protein
MSRPGRGSGGCPPGKHSILARTANAERGDVLWVPGENR